MATVYSGYTTTGSYTKLRVKVTYNYPSTTATATLLYTRTNTYSGATGTSPLTFTFGGKSTTVNNKFFYGQQTDAAVASVNFTVSLAGGSYSGSTSTPYPGGTGYMAFSGSVTLPAHTYTISYNANGGSGAPSAQTKTHGKNLTLSSTKPTRPGHTFKGWSTSSTATSATYNAGSTFTANTSVTLYAVWQINTYTNTINHYQRDAADTAWTHFATTSKTTNYGGTFTPSFTTVPTGYYASYYNTWTSGYGTNLGSGSVTVTSDTVTECYYYPNSYTLTIKPNWGSWNGSTSDQTASQKYTTSKSLSVPTRRGYSFIAWAEQGAGTISNALHSNGSFDSGSNGVYIYNNSGNGVVTHTIQAATTGNPIGSGYELKIAHSGGTSSPGLGGFFDSNTAAANKKWVHAFIAKIPVGYTLNIAHNAIGTGSSEYWLTERVGTGEWEEYSYVIQCGGSGSFGTFGHVYLTGPSGAMTWYLAYSNMYDITEGVGAVNYNYLAGNGSVYAMYYPNDYTLTVNPNGGSWNGTTSASSFTQKYLTTKILEEVPTKTGYKFKYWTATDSPNSSNFGYNVNTGNSELVRYRIAKASSTNLEILLYAPNAAIAKCPTWTNIDGQDELKWHVMSSGSWTRDGYSYNFGTQISIADHNYELLDYIIHLYVYNSSGTQLASVGSINLFDIQLEAGDTYYFGSNNYTLYAQWEKNTSIITYNQNGNIVSNMPEAQEKEFRVNLTLSSLVPVRTRYNFLGWSTDPNASRGSIDAGGTFTLDQDTTLYAIWELIDKTIWIYRAGSIDAVDFVTDTIWMENFADTYTTTHYGVPSAQLSTPPISLSTDNSLKVIFDNILYNDLSLHSFIYGGETVWYAGNPYVARAIYGEFYNSIDTGEPFCIVFNGSQYWLHQNASSTGVEHTASIYILNTNPEKMFKSDGKVYASEFITHDEDAVYLCNDGKIYAKEFIKY